MKWRRADCGAWKSDFVWIAQIEVEPEEIERIGAENNFFRESARSHHKILKKL